MSQHDRWSFGAALVLCALALFVLYQAWLGFGTTFADAGGVRPRTLPAVYGGLLLILATVLAVSSLWGRNKSASTAPPFHRNMPWLRIGGTLLLLILYAGSLAHLPFLPLTAAFLALMFVLYGHRRPVPVLFTALIGAALLDGLFLRILNLPL